MKLYTTIEALLKNEPNYVADDGDLKKWVIISKAQNYDAALISLLLENPEVKTHFFIPVKDVLVFNQALFIEFMEQKNYLNDSFTAYKNKIGLTIDGKFLNQRNEVALVWPYKDCVLEGGQSREEDKREEIFFNEVLAQDEINQLLDPKVFTNAKTFTAQGEKAFESFTRNEQGTITDNLVIKGNNLLALHSLKEEFAGKVKLIYIDPPYNTGSDSFGYNDNFNHSTWLTFMKNRLEVAKKLLTDDGVIFISVDDNEYTYLRSVLDDVFGKERFENIFHIKVRHENRILRQDAKYQKVMEQTICYSMPNYVSNRIEIKKDKDLDYNFDIVLVDEAKPIEIKKINGFDVEIYDRNSYQLVKSKEGNLKEYNIRGSLITQKGSASEFYELFLRERKDKDGNGALYKILKMGEKGDGLGYRFVRQPFDNGNNGFYYQGKPLKVNVEKGNPYPNYFDFEKEFNNSSEEGGVIFKNGKKPEKFIEKLFEISGLKKGNIVLDFHIGSGSSIAVAHKLEVQYIGIEQMQSQIDLSLARLNNVINGDSTGISKSVNWQGGGSFTYLELKKYNQTFIDKILEAKDSNTLLEIWEEMKNKSFLNYNIAIQKQEEHIDDFKKLEFSAQQELLMALLDKNQLYVNLSSLEDKDFECTADELKVTQDFYQLKK